MGYKENQRLRLEARVGIEPTNKGFADLCLTTWLPRLRTALPDCRLKVAADQRRGRGLLIEPLKTKALPHFRLAPLAVRNGAGDGIRTRDIDLGKVALYQLSYSRFNLLILGPTLIRCQSQLGISKGTHGLSR